MKRLFIGLFMLVSLGKTPAQPLDLEPEAEGTRIRHLYYAMDFDVLYRQPRWVYYMLTYDRVNGPASRKDDFRPDPLAPGCAQPEDYKGSGYDRGHLCPAADMKLNDLAMSETFYLSNMSPQDPGFNRGKWATAEKMVRDLIKSEADTLYVVTGPVFIDNQGTIGHSRVAVPGYYFKAVYQPGVGMYALLMPNRKITESIYAWRVSVDLVEELTGIDLFAQLPPEMQNKMEAEIRRW